MIIGGIDSADTFDVGKDLLLAFEDGYARGKRDAIYDFAKKLKDAIVTDYYEHFTACHSSNEIALIEMVKEDIDQIAERMKGGGTDA